MKPMDLYKSMFNNKKISQLSVLLMSLLSVPSFAAFDVYNTDDEYYGNAHVRPFERAIEGSEVIDPEEQAFLNAVALNRVINRWYVRLSVGKPKVRLNDISNISSGVIVNLSPTVTEAQSDLLQVLLAGGYIWEQWAAELELLFSKKLSFSETPVFTGFPVNADIDIQVFCAFFNIQYIIPKFFSWYPTHLQIHLDAGAGGSLKNTNVSTLNPNGTPRQSSSDRTISFAENLGVGARYQITAHFLIDVSYRYFFFNKVNIGPIEGVQLQSNDFQSNGFFLGIMYQF